MVEHCFDVARVSGSTPLVPTSHGFLLLGCENMLKKDKKEKIIKDFSRSEKDTGSCSVQVALLTERINTLTEHFKVHKKDFNSRVGLLHLVSQRKRHLDYLKRENTEKYRSLIEKLKLKK